VHTRIEHGWVGSGRLDTLAQHPKVRAALSLVANRGFVEPPFTPVAAGGNGLVFRAAASGGGSVAVKVPRYGAWELGREGVLEHNIVRESQVLAAIHCEYLPLLIDSHTDGKYLCRTYFDGVLLEELVGSQLMLLDRRRHLVSALLQTARGLFGAFHESPYGCYVIRDFKPRNLVVRDDSGALCLIDAGSVRSEVNMLSKTRRTHRVGSGRWCYWAPEQLLEDRPTLSRRVDYFALGATMFFVLCGYTPYRNSASAEALMGEYLTEYDGLSGRVRAQAERAEIPMQVAEFITACLNPFACERPTGIPEMCE